MKKKPAQKHTHLCRISTYRTQRPHKHTFKYTTNIPIAHLREWHTHTPQTFIYLAAIFFLATDEKEKKNLEKKIFLNSTSEKCAIIFKGINNPHEINRKNSPSNGFQTRKYVSISTVCTFTPHRANAAPRTHREISTFFFFFIIFAFFTFCWIVFVVILRRRHERHRRHISFKFFVFRGIICVWVLPEEHGGIIRKPDDGFNWKWKLRSFCDRTDMKVSWLPFGIGWKNCPKLVLSRSSQLHRARAHIENPRYVPYVCLRMWNLRICRIYIRMSDFSAVSIFRCENLCVFGHNTWALRATQLFLLLLFLIYDFFWVFFFRCDIARDGFIAEAWS